MKRLLQKSPFLLMITLFLLLFAPVIFQGRQFGFRDDSFFYYPLFQYIQSFWNRGELPLWDPTENFGMPIAANPTSSVFYPLKLIFFLPFDYHDLFIWYIIIHLPWAFWGMVQLMKNWRFSSTAAYIAAFAYAFGGGILFQYSNPIFLIGPAWIPWGILLGDRLLRKRSVRAFFGLALVLTMTVLSGDPQSGCFIGLILLTLYCCFRKAEILPENNNLPPNGISSPKRTRIVRVLKSPLFLLMGSAIFAMGLSAVQILPTLEFVRVSDRAEKSAPDSIWQIPQYLLERNQSTKQIAKQAVSANDQYETLPPETDTDRNFDSMNPVSDNYHFSISPICWGTFFCPNFCGNLFPYNSRWGMGSPDDRIWTLSLYMGIIPFLLAMSVFKLRTQRIKSRNIFIRSPFYSLPEPKFSPLLPRVKKNFSLHNILRLGFSWIACIFLLGALGGYGPIWFARAGAVLFGFSNASLNVQSYDPFGGVYWFFQTFLPFFSFFRYPGKLLAPALLAITVLSGIGWDLHRKNRSLKILLTFFLFLFFFGILFLCEKGAEPFHKISLGNQCFFGLFRPDLAWQVVFFGLLQALVFTGIFRFLLFFEQHHKFPNRLKNFSAGGIILILIVLDLFLANKFLIASVPRSVYNKESVCRNIIEKENVVEGHSKQLSSDLERIRIYRMNNWFPQALLNRSAPTRLAERILWERSTLGPRYHLLENISLLTVYGTMSYNDFKNFDSELSSLLLNKKDPVPLFQFIDVSYLLGSEDFSKLFPDNDSIKNIAKTEYDLPLEIRKAHHFPIETSILKIKNSFYPQGRLKLFRTANNFSEQEKFSSSDKEILENIDLFSLDYSKNKQFSLLEGEKISMNSYHNAEISFRVILKEPAEIILLDQFDQNWKATATNEKGVVSVLPLYRALKIFRGITLPPGNHLITMIYSPKSLYLGMKISILFFVFMIFFSFRGNLKKINKR